jgi:hypothetical protein
MFVIQNLGHFAQANKIVVPHNDNLELAIKFANFRACVGSTMKSYEENQNLS